MNDEAGFLETIRYEPHDTACRLIYADWLEERGGPGSAAQAEFLRAWCELAEVSPGEPEFHSLMERLDDLRMNMDPVWLHVMNGDRYRDDRELAVTLVRMHLSSNHAGLEYEIPSRGVEELAEGWTVQYEAPKHKRGKPPGWSKTLFVEKRSFRVHPIPSYGLKLLIIRLQREREAEARP